MKTKSILILFVLLVTCTLSMTAQSAWTPQSSGTNSDLNSIDFYNENFGVAVGEAGTIIRTTDGGITWSAVTSPVTTDLMGVNFVDSTTLIAVGAAGTMLRSTDGGSSWTTVTIPGVGTDLLAIDVRPGGKGIACGRMQTILWTDDGGINWRTLRIDWYGTYYAAQMLDDNTAFIYGENSIMNHLIGKVTQPGDSLSFTYYYINNNGTLTEGKILDGYFFNQDSCITVGAIFPGNATISHYQPWTSNEWDYVYLKTGYYLNGLDFQDNYGVAVGGAYDGSGSLLLETWNKGAAWTEVIENSRKASMNTQVKIIGQTGYIAGQNGKILKKTVATGTGKDLAITKVSAFPNPASGQVNIKINTLNDDKMVIRIIDSMGKIVLEREMNDQLIKIDLQGFIEGVYFYRISPASGNETPRYTGKFIVSQ